MRLVYIGFGWVIGIILAANVTDLPAAAWAGLSALMLVIVVLTWQTPGYRLYNIALLALTLGGLRFTFVATTSDIAQFNNSGGLTLHGTVITDPDIRDDRTLLRVSVDTVQRGANHLASSGNILVQAPRRVDARYGDLVAVTGLLYTPATYDTFSYADFLARQNVFSVMEDARVQVLSTGHGSPFRTWIYDLRRDLGDAIGKMLPEPQAGLLTGILLGNEHGISPELDEDFQVTGAAHIVAVSGSNMVILAEVVRRLLVVAMPRRKGRVTTISILTIFLYTIMVGADAAIVRAAIMVALLIFGESLNRQSYIPASLMLTALFMSLLDPNVLWSLSFQLSFFAVLGIALFADSIQRYLDSLLNRLFPRDIAARAGRFLSEPVVVGLAVQITILPVIILHIERLSVVSMVVNFLIVPVQGYVLLLGSLATVTVFVWPTLAQIWYWLDYLLLAWTIGVVRAFARLPFAEVSIQVSPYLIYTYFTVLIGGALMQATQPDWWYQVRRVLRNRMVVSVTLFAGLGLAVLMIFIALARPDDKLHIWFLDVGHNNAVLIQTPGGAQVLVDGGRYPSRLLTAIGDRIPFTDRELEVLVISQPDPFDTGALPAVLNRYDIGVALTNGQPNQSAAQIELETVLAEYDVLPVTSGYTVEIDDGVMVEVLHPQTTPTLSDSIGDHPLVLRVTYGEVSFLLPSDLSQSAQEDLLEAGVWPLATVLQLPNHGTARSLDGAFLAAVQPQAIVIQTDIANRRGDPDPDILAMLPEDVPLFRTDEQGVIHMWTDGAELWTEQ